MGGPVGYPGARRPSRGGLCKTLLAWGADRGATRAYMHAHDTGATDLADALGFRLHHRRRYLLARRMDTV